MIKTLVNNAQQPIATLIFAHGAGAGQDSAFMQNMAEALGKQSINVVRFNFSYMQKSKELGKRRPPDRADKLLSHFNTVLEEVDQGLPLFIGGKSMGGRMASMLVQQSNALGCICMGYPFHPLGKPEKLRIEHLQQIDKPVLILQGERDSMGSRQEIMEYKLSECVQLDYLPDGDHSFKPRKVSGHSLQNNLDQVVSTTLKFIHSNLP